MTVNMSESQLDAMESDYTKDLNKGENVCLRSLGSKYGISAATAKKKLNDRGIDTSNKAKFQKNAADLIRQIELVLYKYRNEHNILRMTVRQIYYQLASKNIVELTDKGYELVQRTLKNARTKRVIPYDFIEDRTRQPANVAMWQDPNDFINSVVPAYRKDIWQNQENYIEVWLEKSALYGVIHPVTNKYGVTLQVTRGYASVSTLYDATSRLGQDDTILYLGDHDPSGLDIERSIRDSFLDDHGLDINVKRIAVRWKDYKKYNLIPQPIKKNDRRSINYKYEYQFELDALPPNILINRTKFHIKKNLDMDMLKETFRVQSRELNTIKTTLRVV